MPKIPFGKIQNEEWRHRAALGLIRGVSCYNKFGENPDIGTASDPEDVWDGGDTYTFSSTADNTQLSSSDNSDTQLLTIEGLDANWDYVVQTKALTGQTPVSLDTPLIRTFRMSNESPGTTDIAGTAYLSTTGATLSTGTPTVATTIRAQIVNGNNQTLMCIYSVPRNQTALFVSGYVAFSKGVGSSVTANFSWRARPFGSVFAVKSKIACMSTGNSTWDYTYGIPVVVPEKADIKIVCDEVSATVGVAGGFDVILFDNTIFGIG